MSGKRDDEERRGQWTQQLHSQQQERQRQQLRQQLHSENSENSEASSNNAALSPPQSAEFKRNSRDKIFSNASTTLALQKKHDNQSNDYFGPTSISEVIDASETLEEFEECEREIVRQLDDEALYKSNERADDFSGHRQTQDVNINSISIDFDGMNNKSDEAISGQRGFIAIEPKTSAGDHKPASTTQFSGFAVPSPDDFQLHDRPLKRPVADIGLRAASSRQRSLGQPASNLANAMSNSLTFAGEMAAAVAGNTAANPPLLGTSETIYGSNLPSQPSQQYESINKRPPATASNTKSEAKTVGNNGTTSLPMTTDLNEVLRYVAVYTPEDIDIEPLLQPFLLDYIPAVGDVDPFIKIPRPDQEESLLGLVVLDEPSEIQSDSTMIDLRLYQRSRSGTLSDAPVKTINRADRNKQQIERWIASTREARKTRPLDRVNAASGGPPLPDVETLMQEWPRPLEQLINSESFPNANLDVSLQDYVDICLSLFDIPVRDGRRVQALHVLFSLYLEFRNSQHFRSIAAANNNNDRNYNMHNNDTLQTANGRRNNNKRGSRGYSASPLAPSRNNNRLEL